MKRYQIFISSTYKDLQEERQEVLKSILKLRHIPVGMEHFVATNEEQFEYIKRLLDETDYYVVIIGNRYGSIGDDGISLMLDLIQNKSYKTLEKKLCIIEW